MQPQRHSHTELRSRNGTFAVSVLSVDGIVQFVSPTFLSATGWNEQEWLGRPFSLLLHNDEVERVGKVYEKLAFRESIDLGPTQYVAKNGTIVTLNSSLVPRAAEKETDVLWLIHCNPEEIADCDNSQLSQVVPLFPEGTRNHDSPNVDQTGLLGLFQTLLANAPVGVALFDESLKFICLNQTFSRMTGLSPDQQLGYSLMQVMPRVAGLIEPDLRRVLRQGHPVTGQEVALQRFPLSDHSRWALLSFYPVPDARGDMCGVAIIAVDITDRKRADKALRESEDRFRLAVDATKLGTWDFSFETGKAVWSERTKAIFGLPPETNINEKLFLTKVHHEDYQRVTEAIELAKDPKSGGDYRIEYRIVGAKDGLPHWVAARGKVSFDKNGTPLRFIGTSLDVTEQKNAEEALKKLSDELTLSNRALDAFAQTASHDLKEPLRVVSCFAKLLSSAYKSKDDAHTDEYIGHITSGAQRMSHLIDSILEYAVAGRTNLEFSPVDCSFVMETVLKNLKVSIEEAHVEIIHEPMPVVSGNLDLISQIFQNLISNAIKFRSNDDPKIYVDVDEYGQDWVFAVRDNGIGIHSDHLETIFSPFKRLNSREQYAGSGLGLAIVKENVERHGGRIWVTSEVGKGSTFHFLLPSLEKRK